LICLNLDIKRSS